MYITYILYSESIDGYYVGSTNDLEDRMLRHNRDQGKHTKRGIPWRIVKTFEFSTRREAVRLELKIKKRGAKRFLADL